VLEKKFFLFNIYELNKLQGLLAGKKFQGEKELGGELGFTIDLNLFFQEN